MFVLSSLLLQLDSGVLPFGFAAVIFIAKVVSVAKWSMYIFGTGPYVVYFIVWENHYLFSPLGLSPLDLSPSYSISTSLSGTQKIRPLYLLLTYTETPCLFLGSCNL